jgi:protein-S-isoprenylcysteine O-methyltransferase Ste14
MSDGISFALGAIILVVSAIMGVILLLAPGSIRLQRPECGWVGWTFNFVNLLFFFLLIPLSGLLLMGFLSEPIHRIIEYPPVSGWILLDVIGLLLFLAGSLLLLWSRLALRRSFRLGGVKPDSEDYLTMHGPYVYLRHPMYLSAILVLMGVAGMLSSLLMALMAGFMIWLVVLLIPREEEQLDQAYPIAYREYCRRVPRVMLTSRF